MSKKALVAMSGGVDSSVAVYLAQKAGYECIGVTMKLYDGKSSCSKKKTCCSLSDVEDARSVAAKMEIPFYVFDYREEFKERVIDKFIAEYKVGKTPNPCIDCNYYMKFQYLYEHGKQLGCDVIVTGHYARVCYNGQENQYELHQGRDEKKDQSYVLYSLNQEQLKHTFFPLGEYSKEEIRKIADELGFVNASKPDSQDICFVEGESYTTYLESMGMEGQKGELINTAGEKIGDHPGYFYYTIGQRKGLGIAGKTPYYVVDLDPNLNRVILGEKNELLRHSFWVEDLKWTIDEQESKELKCYVRYRYHQSPVKAIIKNEGKNSWKVELEEAVGGIAPGQAAVFYDKSRVLGGGTIRKNNCQPANNFMVDNQKL